MTKFLAVLSLALLELAAVTRPVAAQAWVPRAREGSVTFIAQTIDHYGRFTANGARAQCCGTTNVAVDADMDYAFTDRWSISAGLPYIFSKYRGESPKASPVSGFLDYLPVDACHCVHSTFQDFGFTTRYNVLSVHRRFVVTPSVSVGVPSHAYDHVGEAVAGFGLKELRLGVDVGQRLDSFLRGLSVEGRYTYAVVPRVLDVAHNRSNALLDVGFAFARHVTVDSILHWQHTYGGLHFPDDVGPFPERYADFHRLLQDNYLQAGGGVSYAMGQWDVSGSYLTTIQGTNSHEVRVFTVSVGWQFRAGG